MFGIGELFRTAKRLREIGLVGLNERNANYILMHNQRKYYPRVDDKVITKQLAIEHGLPVPELYALVKEEHEIAELKEKIKDKEQFVVKPAHGSGGDGILVITGRKGNNYRKASGAFINQEDFEHHISNALSGLFSLGGQPDHVLVEYCVQFDPIFDHVSYKGVPDIRIIVFKGYPIMGMIRLPTRQSDGKANLHQGAIGVGIDLPTGKTKRGVWSGQPIKEHPDTEQSIIDLQIPRWDELMLIAAQSSDLSGLGYVGVDIVLDKNLGPLILELNARPGLAIQMANGNGLSPRLKKIEALTELSKDPLERVAFSKANFPTT
jgi:alpha-L-glutamate ligase-like protein